MKQVTDFKNKVKRQKRSTALSKATWVVGIDIGKKNLSCALMNKAQTVQYQFNTEASFSGHKKLLERIKEKTKGRGRVVYAMEPTGHYWMVLGQFFEDHNQQDVLIHPLSVARSREVSRLNRGKTDPMDARVIGELALRGIAPPPKSSRIIGQRFDFWLVNLWTEKKILSEKKIGLTVMLKRHCRIF